ncbi:MAG: tRNA (adenosine(37)-N6)-threonylcarbamoyltransferase complex ATPase subunit type 1 TsaE [Lentimicrobiaceae bacterium]|jgi:tRNA threonylcarbamoyladenosine biosynthesis protein TsaE|nr:tRNA (adenosine(37)-N6)-threonylcarbamoyltransferase complex ATPase subunit type 1 TsaE [Lentimicrobiaceae bacterium]MCP4910201.1 tRNA (adenosine(37)-N6)-threonylcarbamoyltransferase complex ATPase subunit type 1 TsaE [Bacteroidota bacterium]MBT3453764.1 tRNA (adenosine(37)-N6)-threonylcarbamoyltransferase complex ATPase subunit type 1 TsaE [Lentimicrobiaceae bacterium]MBT3819443.1 tRNA (adenosine(37)-N6)-threonylcarbamoyltransferase complex ATPase subunit type 1 TsaE [Lentimicrobiaceae bacte
MKTITINSLSELKMAAQNILENSGDETIFALNGKMGAGKTTLIKAFCDVLGVKEVVSSPTFSLVNEYSDKSNNSVFHFDFYRIKKLDEVYDIGYEEYFYSNCRCFIEWPELIAELLPENFVYILIDEIENGKRTISYKIK